MLLLVGKLMKVKLVLFFCWDWQQHLLGWWWEVSVPVSHIMILPIATDLKNCMTLFHFSLLSKLLEISAKGFWQVFVLLPIPWIVSDFRDSGTCSTDQSSDTDWLTSFGCEAHGEDFETPWYKMAATQQWDLLCIINSKTALLSSYLLAWSRKETV